MGDSTANTLEHASNVTTFMPDHGPSSHLTSSHSQPPLDDGLTLMHVSSIDQVVAATAVNTTTAPAVASEIPTTHGGLYTDSSHFNENMRSRKRRNTTTLNSHNADIHINHAGSAISVPWTEPMFATPVSNNASVATAAVSSINSIPFPSIIDSALVTSPSSNSLTYQEDTIKQQHMLLATAGAHASFNGAAGIVDHAMLSSFGLTSPMNAYPESFTLDDSGGCGSGNGATAIQDLDGQMAAPITHQPHATSSGRRGIDLHITVSRARADSLHSIASQTNMFSPSFKEALEAPSSYYSTSPAAGYSFGLSTPVSDYTNNPHSILQSPVHHNPAASALGQDPGASSLHFETPTPTSAFSHLQSLMPIQADTHHHYLNPSSINPSDADLSANSYLAYAADTSSIYGPGFHQGLHIAISNGSGGCDISAQQAVDPSQIQHTVYHPSDNDNIGSIGNEPAHRSDISATKSSAKTTVPFPGLPDTNLLSPPAGGGVQGSKARSSNIVAFESQDLAGPERKSRGRAGEPRGRKRAATAATCVRSEFPSSPPPVTSPRMTRGISQRFSKNSFSRPRSNSTVTTSATLIRVGDSLRRGSIHTVQGQGDKLAMILTSKVAQKSYGSEKRFLCPPPTVLLFGSNWDISALPSHHLGGGSSALENSQGLSRFPKIDVSVPVPSEVLASLGNVGGADKSMSQLCARSISGIEWIESPGKAVSVPAKGSRSEKATLDPGAYLTGRFVSRQLFINDVDEKNKKIEVCVKLIDPNTNTLLNDFYSTPIKVISKPSKKRQNTKNAELCIHHGSMISLFNRLRSQTVSTKYLGMKHSIADGWKRPAWFPGGEDRPSEKLSKAEGDWNQNEFVARTSFWDPFLIWIVDPNMSKEQIESYNQQMPQESFCGFPVPPPHAIEPRVPFDLQGVTADTGPQPFASPLVDGSPGTSQPFYNNVIHYNQPVVLQCMSTGMLSPVFIIRKIDKGSIATGAFYGNDLSNNAQGDPVSQLHKIALEVYEENPSQQPLDSTGILSRGKYFTCSQDKIYAEPTVKGKQLDRNMQGFHHHHFQQQQQQQSQDLGPHVYSGGGGDDGTAASQLYGFPSQSLARRATTSAVSPLARTATGPPTTTWTEDVGDGSVWTIVGTDCAMYRFGLACGSSAVGGASKEEHNLHMSPTAAATVPDGGGGGGDGCGIAMQSQQQQQQHGSANILMGLMSSPQQYQQLPSVQNPAELSMMLPISPLPQSNNVHTHFKQLTYAGDSSANAVASMPPTFDISHTVSSAIESAGIYTIIAQQQQLMHGLDHGNRHGMSRPSRNNTISYHAEPNGFPGAMIPEVSSSSSLSLSSSSSSSISSETNPSGINISILPVVHRVEPKKCKVSRHDLASEHLKREIITIRGQNFVDGIKVFFDEVPSQRVDFENSEEIYCLAPLPKDFLDISNSKLRRKSFDDEGYTEQPYLEVAGIYDGGKDSSVHTTLVAAATPTNENNEPELRNPGTDGPAVSSKGPSIRKVPIFLMLPNSTAKLKTGYTFTLTY